MAITVKATASLADLLKSRGREEEAEQIVADAANINRPEQQ
jgi:hypothetical protein